METQSFQMVRRGVALVARQAILRVDGVPLFHARVPVGFREDGSGGDGYASGIAFDERLLLNQDVELHGINEEVVGWDAEPLQSCGHSLAGGLINVPRVNALGVDFRDGPGEGVFANAFAEPGTAFWGELFRVIKADNSALGIENHCGGDHRAKQRASSGFVNTGDARPTQLARRSLETGRAEPVHRWGILARCGIGDAAFS